MITRPIHLTVLATALAGAVLLGGCGSDDEGSSTTTAAEESSGGDASSSSAAGGGGGSDVAMGGPVRELPGLSDYADLPLDEFLETVFEFPADVPVPDLELARAYTQAEGLAGSSGSISYGADYAAPGSVDEAFEAFEAAVDGAVWSPEGEVEETSEGYFSRTYASSSGEVSSVTVVFQEDEEELAVTARRDAPAGALPPTELWSWAGEVPTGPGTTLGSWLVQIPDSGGGPAVLLDMRWTSEPGTYDAIAAFVSALPSGVLVPGEVTTATDPFVETEVAVTAEGGFEGTYSVSVSSPESSPSTILGGTVSLEG